MNTLQEPNVAAGAQGQIEPFTLNAVTNGTQSPMPFADDARQQAEADTALAALSMISSNTQSDVKTADSSGSEKPQGAPSQTADEKKADHEAAEAKRKADWDAKQAEKKAALAKALDDLLAMSDDDVMGESVKRTGTDLERLTRRNMKICVTEHVQTVCLDNPVFARNVCHPKKSMINCFKYINKKAEEYVKSELELMGQKAIGTIGEDVPDDLCYKWAEDYFNDSDAEVDKEKDDVFVPKTVSGGTASSRSKKKEPAKKKEPEKPAPKADTDQLQLDMLGSA